MVFLSSTFLHAEQHREIAAAFTFLLLWLPFSTEPHCGLQFATNAGLSQVGHGKRKSKEGSAQEAEKVCWPSLGYASFKKPSPRGRCCWIEDASIMCGRCHGSISRCSRARPCISKVFGRKWRFPIFNCGLQVCERMPLLSSMPRPIFALYVIHHKNITFMCMSGCAYLHETMLLICFAFMQRLSEAGSAR